MKTKTIELFTFDELSEEQQQAAHEKWARDFVYPWHAENAACMKAFTDLFPVKITRSETVYITSHGNLDGQQMEELSGQRLATYLWNNFRQIYKAKQYWICDGRPNTVGVNSKHRDSRIFIIEDGCPLTGWCIDNAILEPVFTFLRRPDSRNFYNLMMDCIQSYQTAIEQDFEYLQSMEAFKEDSAANEWYFNEDGEIEYE